MKVFKAISAAHEDVLVREVNKLGIKKEDIQQIVFNSEFCVYVLYYWSEYVKEDVDKKYEELINNNNEREDDIINDTFGNA